MNRSTSSTASRLTHHAVALGLGLLLGRAVAMMAQQHEGSLFACCIALVFIASSSASFVMLVLSQQPGPRGAVQTRRVHGLVGMIGLGLVLSLQAFELLV